MKISTNFVRPVQQAVMPLMIAMWLVALGFVAGTWWLLGDSADMRGELPQLRQRFERINTERSAVSAETQMPNAQELAETRERVAKINAAAQTKGVPTSALLAELEKQLPPEAWLTSFHHRAGEGDVVLVASAANADPLSAFLLKLERNPLFEQVMLMRELHPTGAGKPSVQFEIRLKVRL